jgi:hypothetical protein
MPDIILILLISIIAIALVVLIGAIIIKRQDNKRDLESINKPETQYKIKTNYITQTEREFARAIKEIIKEKYILLPQVPLSQLVIKKPATRYKNELYRIIDFCIFTKEYRPLVCIEINDETHKTKSRYARDQKVKDILAKAELPLITLWVSYGINKEYIEKRLSEHLEIEP